MTCLYPLLSYFLLFLFLLLLCSNSLPCFTSSICSCRLLCGLFQAQTGLWVWTVLTCVTVTTGKRMCRWSFSHMMQELTVGSPSLLQTLKPSRRTKLHRWVNLSQEQHWSKGIIRNHMATEISLLQLVLAIKCTLFFLHFMLSTGINCYCAIKGDLLLSSLPTHLHS